MSTAYSTYLDSLVAQRSELVAVFELAADFWNWGGVTHDHVSGFCATCRAVVRISRGENPGRRS